MLKAIGLTILVVSIGYVYSIGDPYPNCGERLVEGVRKRIVGGKVSVQGSWPWQVALLNSGTQMCGGTLINDQWIVTAAHCFDSTTYHGYWKAALGEHKLGTGEGFEQTMSVAQIIFAENYKAGNFYYNDIALIKLSRPVTLNKYVYPSCLLRPNQTFPTGEECYVTGWGLTGWHGDRPEALMQAKVKLVDSEVCAKSYSSGKIHSDVLCAGFAEGGKGACQGDSGGPLVCQKDGRFYLTGVVSWSGTCGDPHKYTVYTSMSSWTRGVQAVIKAYK